MKYSTKEYKNLYVSDVTKVSKEVENSMLLCGDKNWDYYFTKKDPGQSEEDLGPVTLFVFGGPDDAREFIDITDLLVLDWEITKHLSRVLCSTPKQGED